MKALYARFGYYTQYRFTDDGVLKVSLMSMLRGFLIIMGGTFLGITPLFFISFTFYPNGVPAGPLLDALTGLTLVVGIGVPVGLLFWRVRVRARTPDNALPPKSVTFIPYSEIKDLRILGHQATIVTTSKKYIAILEPDSAAGIRSLEEMMAGRLSYGVQDLSKVRRGKLIGSLSSLLFVAITIWRLVSFYSSAYYSETAASAIALVALLAVAQSLFDIVNSTSGNWMLARDWSIPGYYGAWFVFGVVAANLSRSLPGQISNLGLFGSIVPVYSSPVFPNNSQDWAVFAGVVGLAVLAGLFLSLSFSNTGQKVNVGLFRWVGPGYIIATLLFTLGGIAVYEIFFVLQAAAFLSMKVEKQNPRTTMIRRSGHGVNSEN